MTAEVIPVRAIGLFPYEVLKTLFHRDEDAKLRGEGKVLPIE